MEFAGQTFASIGLSPGTYAWTWGSGIDADSFTVEIGPAVPEPASALSVGIGLIGHCRDALVAAASRNSLLLPSNV